MAEKKTVDSTVIAENLVKDSAPVVLGDYTVTLMWRRSSLGLGDDSLVGYRAERLKMYPPNITDQTHALSIAEQIKVGQAQIRNDDSQEQYDFKPGQKDDGRDAIGVYDYSEPAERFEAERNVADSIQNELEGQIARRRASEIERTAKRLDEKDDASKKTSESAEA